MLHTNQKCDKHTVYGEKMNYELLTHEIIELSDFSTTIGV